MWILALLAFACLSSRAYFSSQSPFPFSHLLIGSSVSIPIDVGGCNSGAVYLCGGGVAVIVGWGSSSSFGVVIGAGIGGRS